MAAQLINSSERCVDEALEGLAATHPGLYLLPNQRVIVERDRLIDGAKKKLVLVSGGGSGHEPFSAGYIGRGMLSGAVAGPIFTSPPSSSVANLIATLGTDNPEGVLVIVFNYTGDRVNFGQAIEKCRNIGIKADMYISGDDCALTRLEGTAGRRGLCGTLFIFKIVGAMAEKGASLEEAMATCRKLGNAIGTIGVAASGCTLPGATSPLITIADGMLELGLGVHGEAGAKSMKAGPVKEVVNALLSHMTREDSASRLDLQQGEEVAVIVNNLGSVSQLEMSVITREIVLQLRSRGLRPIRIYQGSMMTSVDMKGFHVSILRLVDPNWVVLLDDPTTAPSWPTPFVPIENPSAALKMPSFCLDFTAIKQSSSDYTLEHHKHKEVFKTCLEAVIRDIPQHENLLNQLDTGCGDGDCGSTLIGGISAFAKRLPELDFSHPGRILNVLSDIASENMGGTSGGLYSILFAAAGNEMASRLAKASSHREIWLDSFRVGAQAVTKYGGASQGDRTMLDAILPALNALESCKDEDDLRFVLKSLAEAANDGAQKTAQMKARAGRASYVRSENVTGEDAGARAVALVLLAMSKY